MTRKTDVSKEINFEVLMKPVYTKKIVFRLGKYMAVIGILNKRKLCFR